MVSKALLLSGINPKAIDIPYTLPGLYTFSTQSKTERKRIIAYLDLLISTKVPCRLILGDGHVSENVIVQSFDGQDVKSFYDDTSSYYQMPIESIKEITPMNSILPPIKIAHISSISNILILGIL